MTNVPKYNLILKIRSPQNAPHHKSCSLIHTQGTELWTDRKKAIIVPDDEDRVIRIGINTLKQSRYMYIVGKHSINM